jgi:hypothetical protein
LLAPAAPLLLPRDPVLLLLLLLLGQSLAALLDRQLELLLA